MARRTLDETRQLLIDEGIRMLHERGVSVSVTNVRLADVVAAAGLTTGAAYRCWANQAAFHRDLAEAAARWRDRASIAETVEGIRDLVERQAPVAEVLRVGAEANLYRFPENIPFLTTIALRASAVADESVAEASRYHLHSAVESFGDLYDALLKVYGLRMREPYTITLLAAALAALSEGFVLQAMIGEPHPRVERTDIGDGVGSDWSLLACAAQAIVEHFTEPAVDDDHWGPGTGTDVEADRRVGGTGDARGEAAQEPLP